MKRLLVDGYNVIRSTPPYKQLAEQDLESAREALVSDVAAYAQQEWDATIVFDGGGNPRSDGKAHEFAGIAIIFSRYGVSADTVIEGLARAARDRGERIDVVTSDAQTQWAVLGGKVVRRSSAEFSSELRAGRDEWGDFLPAGSATSRVEDLIDAEVKEILSKWARGEQ